MSQRKKKRKPAAVRGLGTEKRNEKERERVCRINAEYDRLVEQLGGMIVNPGKEWKREAVAEKTSGKSKLRKLDILFEASNYLKELMQESEEVKIKDVEATHNPFYHSPSMCPSEPPLVSTTTTIPESDLECDEMFEAIVPPDNDDKMITTTSSLTALPQEEEEGEELEGCPQPVAPLSVQTNGYSQQHSHLHLQQPGLQQMAAAFFPLSPDDSPTPPGPNLQNTAEILSPEQVPLPSSTVSALPAPDNISPDLYPMPHCFQQAITGLVWSPSPCDSTSIAPLSPYPPPGDQAMTGCYYSAFYQGEL